MFYTLRKIIIAGAFVFWGLLGYRLWLHPDTFPTFAERYLAQKESERIQREDSGKIIGTMTGIVSSVVDGRAILLRDANGVIYTFGLAGISVPPWHDTDTREYLVDLIKDKQVIVAVVLLNQYRSGLGVVYLNKVPVNFQLVSTGNAGVYSPALDKLPWEMQESLRRASHQARAAGKGIWQPPEKLSAGTTR